MEVLGERRCLGRLDDALEKVWSLG